MKVLSIGNSFSEDAHCYLHGLAEANGIDLTVVNLMIGGCTLERHAKNITENRAEYGYQLNGRRIKEQVTAADILKQEKWDVVTVQQASPLSGKADSYFPFLNTVLDCVKELSPNSKIYFHKTWAYEEDYKNPSFSAYNFNQEEMYRKINEATENMQSKVGLPIIPTGDVIQALRKDGEFDYKKTGHSLNRDGTHLSAFYGRYAAAATWLSTLMGFDIRKSKFAPTIDKISADREIIKAINETVYKVVNSK